VQTSGGGFSIGIVPTEMRTGNTPEPAANTYQEDSKEIPTTNQEEIGISSDDDPVEIAEDTNSIGTDMAEQRLA